MKQRDKSDNNQSVPARFRHRISRLHGTHFHPAEPPGHLTGLRDFCCHGNNDVSHQHNNNNKEKKIKRAPATMPHELNSSNAIVNRLKSDGRVSGRKSTQSSVSPRYPSKTVFFCSSSGEEKYLLFPKCCQ